MTADELLAAARAGDLDRLGTDRDAVAAAIEGYAEAGDGALALELAEKAWRIWFSRAELEQGSKSMAAALAAPGADRPTSARAHVLYADGAFAFRAGDQERSRTRNDEALAVARVAADLRGECDALTGLARVALRDGDYGLVAELAGEARQRARSAGDLAAETAPLHLLAAGTRLAGDYLRARELYTESLELNRALGHPGWVAMELHNLGWVELHLGDLEAAEARFRERDAAEGGEDSYASAWRELNWAAVAAGRGESEEARARFDAGRAALSALGVALDPDDQAEVDWLDDQLARTR
jgi:hypothetical protein